MGTLSVFRFIKDNCRELCLISLMVAIVLCYMMWLHWIILTMLIRAITDV